MIYYSLFFAGVVANITAQILLKIGSGFLNKSAGTAIFAKLKTMASNPYFLFAIIFYAISFITYSIVLSKLELSKAYPVASALAIVAVSAISIIFFHEVTNLTKITGLVLCIIGIFLIFK